MKPYNLFLDDKRTPAEAYDLWKNNPMPDHKEQLYLDCKWVVVRSHREFVEYISTNYVNEGVIPCRVSFDHDLHPEHYAIGAAFMFQDFDYTLSSVPTGLESARWLLRFIKLNDLKFPEYLIHSHNTAGSRNIKYVIEETLKQNTYTFH